MSTPSVVVFDVNETLSDMAPLGRRFVDMGAPEASAQIWFASLLRDAFALTAAGGTEKFAVMGSEGLRTVLAGVQLDRDLDSAIEHIMSGFMALEVHPDVPDGIRALTATGRRLVTLSNGSAAVAERLLTGAGLREEFDRLLSVEEAGAWKPARASYAYAAEVCGVDLSDMILVAVHPWDIDGAARAGMQTAFINRNRRPYPGYFNAPTHTVPALPELAERLTG